MSRIYQNHRALWLERMVKENNFSRGAEIGVLRGPTYKHLLNNCPHLTLIGVDIFYDDKLWKSSPIETRVKTTEDLLKLPTTPWYHELLEFSNNIGPRAILYRDLSNKAHSKVKDESLDFVFIDAGHTEQSVLEDIKCWDPKVKKGGIVAGHDIDWMGVRMAVSNKYIKYETAQDNCWFVRK